MKALQHKGLIFLIVKTKMELNNLNDHIAEWLKIIVDRELHDTFSSKNTASHKRVNKS